MKAIETHYDGYRFRSRLEARWAYFFNKAGVRYEYEPEGFVVDGKPYLPDFYLPNTYLRNKETLGVYVEIKRDGGEFLHEKFSKPLVVFFGEPLLNIWGGYWGTGGHQVYPHWDDNMLFWICKKCNATKIEFQESNYDYCPVCDKGSCDDHYMNNLARWARFQRF
jgi:hypothetical protein